MNTVELKSYIIENNKAPQILEYIGCYNIRPHKKFYSFSTKFNTKASSTSLTKRNLKVKVWADNAANIHGDIFNLCSSLLKISIGDSIKLVHEILGFEYDGFSEITDDQLEKLREVIGEKEDEKQELIFFSKEEVLKYYEPSPYIDWIKEGILPGTQELFGIGYSRSYNRVVIPHRYYKNKKDNYVGLVGRTLNKAYKELGIPKYFPLIIYPKSQNLFGLYENKKTIRKVGYINVFEAEKSVMKRHSRLDRTGVALCCHEISDIQVDIILALNVDVVVQMDSDVPLNEVRKICERFYGKRKVYYIVDEFNLLGEKESTADKHNKIYNFLWNRKKLYDPEEHDTYMNYKNRIELERKWY